MNRNNKEAYPYLYEKKKLSEFDERFGVKFNLCIVDKVRTPGEKMRLTKRTLEEQLVLFEFKDDICYTFDGDDIQKLDVLQRISTYSTPQSSNKNITELSPMERINKRIAEMQKPTCSSFITPDKQTNKKLKLSNSKV